MHGLIAEPVRTDNLFDKATYQKDPVQGENTQISYLYFSLADGKPISRKQLVPRILLPCFESILSVTWGSHHES